MEQQENGWVGAAQVVNMRSTRLMRDQLDCSLGDVYLCKQFMVAAGSFQMDAADMSNMNLSVRAVAGMQCGL